MNLDLEHYTLSDAGLVREHNEDFSGCWIPGSENEGRTRGWLFALADGVGGEERGEVASKTAVETVIEEFQAGPRGEALTVLLPRIVQKANIRVYERGRTASPGGSRMATTLVACAFRYDRVAVAHTGDSRCYLIRRGEALQLTRDHTLVAEQVRMGILSEREAELADTRHILSRSLGSDLVVNVDIDEHPIHEGDVLVLCSDGLHGAVKGAEMAGMLGKHPGLESAAREMIALACKRDGSDNASVLLVRVRSTERMGMYRGRPYKLR